MGGAPDLVAAIRLADERHEMFPVGSTVVVGVSGGPDSVALAHVMATYAPNRGIGVHIAHLDHGLRSTPDLERDHVVGVARALGLPVTVGARSASEFASGLGRGVEHGARVVRYGFLARVAAEVGAAIVAVGHTADDQAETVLLHLLRGAGLDGLAAMRPVGAYPLSAAEVSAAEPDWAGADEMPRLVRPLLGVGRGEVSAYIAQTGLAALEDPTNSDRTLMRNRVRLEALPVLEDLNPRVRGALARTAESVADDLTLIEELVDRAWQSAVLEDTGHRVVFDRLALLGYAEALQRRLLRAALRRVGGGAQDVGWLHIESAREAVTAGSARAAVDAPGRLRVERDGPWVVVEGRRSARPTDDGPWSVPLRVPGSVSLPGGWSVTAELLAPGSALHRPTGWTVRLDLDRVGSALRARRRKRGDRIASLGLSGRHRALQDVFVDDRVPRRERDLWPVIESTKGIAWLPGLRSCGWAAVTPSTAHVLELSARPPARVAATLPEGARRGSASSGAPLA